MVVEERFGSGPETCSQVEFLWPSHFQGPWPAVVRGKFGLGLALITQEANGQHKSSSPAPHQPECCFLLVSPCCFLMAKNLPQGNTSKDHQLNCGWRSIFYAWSCKKIWFFSSVTELILLLLLLLWLGLTCGKCLWLPYWGRKQKQDSGKKKTPFFSSGITFVFIVSTHKWSFPDLMILSFYDSKIWGRLFKKEHQDIFF